MTEPCWSLEDIPANVTKAKTQTQRKASPKKKALPALSSAPSLMSRSAKRALSLIMTVTTLAGLAVFWPRLTVEPGGQIDPSTPYPIIFTITNTGFVTVRNVEPFIGVCKLSFDRGSELHITGQTCTPAGPLKAKIRMKEWPIAALAMDEKHQVRLDDAFRPGPLVKLLDADISIIISYELWYLPIRGEKEFRFKTRAERDGKLSWIPRPMD